jgi:hypothetical protein
MIGKIDVRPVFKGHIDSLRDRAGKIIWADIIGFYLIPFAVSAYLTIAGFTVVEKYINTAIIAQTILIPLLLNVVMMIYGLIDRVESKRERHSKDNEDALVNVDNKCLRLLRQLYDTLAYTIIMSAMCLFSLAVYTVQRFHDVFVYANRFLLYFLIIHIFLSALMIMKRLHRLFEKQFDGA